jgi:hypothetical protein
MHSRLHVDVTVHLRLVNRFQMSEEVSLLFVLVAAVRAVEGEALVVDFLQVIVEVDLVGVFLAATVTNELLQPLMDHLDNKKTFLSICDIDFFNFPHCQVQNFKISNHSKQN